MTRVVDEGVPNLDRAASSAPDFSRAASPSNPSIPSGEAPHFSTKTNLGEVIVVDDEPAIVESVKRTLEREGYHVIGVTDPQQALQHLRAGRAGLLLSDLMMPSMTGLELLRASKAIAPECEVIVMTAFGTVETAVDAMKEGAYDFVSKPIKRAHLVRIVKNALDKQSLLAENKQLKAELAARSSRELVGNSAPWRACLDMALQAASSDATVLLLGETGTGKELLARSIHDNSPRKAGPFVAVNCAALPESILEAELFGYEKGAFTGAVSRREGRFEAAQGGTLFLDEIGEIPKHLQVKLLRALQEGEIEPLGGGGKAKKLDIRLVSATNVDLAAEVKAGRFREDLYYRLHVIPVALPALRDRRDDVPLLVNHFVRLYASKNNKPVSGVSPGAMQKFIDYGWPGNVRELENTVERSVVLTRHAHIEEDVLPREITQAIPSAGALTFQLGTPLADIEMQMINETLRHTRGDKKLAAKLLGIATRTIYRRLEDGDALDAGDAETARAASEREQGDH